MIGKIKKQKGFSLIETLVVLSIIAIISVIVTPAYQSLKPHLQLDSVTRDMVADLRYAQQKAVTEQVVYLVSFNSLSNSYSITKEGSEVALLNKKIPSGITILSVSSLTDNAVRFNAAGGVSESGSITLKNSQDKTSVIEIKPSGYVKIN